MTSKRVTNIRIFYDDGDYADIYPARSLQGKVPIETVTIRLEVKNND